MEKKNQSNKIKRRKFLQTGSTFAATSIFLPLGGYKIFDLHNTTLAPPTIPNPDPDPSAPATIDNPNYCSDPVFQCGVTIDASTGLKTMCRDYSPYGIVNGTNNQSYEYVYDPFFENTQIPYLALKRTKKFHERQAVGRRDFLLNP